MKIKLLWIVSVVIFVGIVIILLFALNSFAKQEVKSHISEYLSSTLNLNEYPDVEIKGRFNIFSGYCEEVDISVGSLEYGGFIFNEADIELKELKFDPFDMLLNSEKVNVAISEIMMKTVVSQDELNRFFVSRFPGLSIRLSGDEVITSGILQISNEEFNFEFTGDIEISGENIITLNPRNIIVEGYNLSGDAMNSILNNLSYDINFGQLPLDVKINRIFIYEGFMDVLWQSEDIIIEIN